MVVSRDNTDSAPGIAARSIAQTILGEVLRKRRPLDAVLDGALSGSGLSIRDAGFARVIASETLRRFGQLESLLRVFVPKSPPPHRAGPTLEILLAGACEILFLGVAAHAAVDAANRLALRDSKAVHFKPLINATLRRIALEGQSILGQKDAVRLNTPDWLWERWCRAFGETLAREIAQAHSIEPPLDIVPRANGVITIEGAMHLPGGVLRLRDAGPVESLPGFAEGNWWVQDFAASLPARLFGNVRGKTVIDLCAAPGGKTAQLAATGARVTAVEREASRLARLQSNFDRLRLSAELIEADVLDFAPAAKAECVLLDAPCSATGTIRRHPDLPWIKGASDVIASARNASELLECAADMVATDGLLVFAVCSLEEEEGAEQIADFLARHAEFRREPLALADVFGMAQLINAEGDLRTLPCHLAEQGGMDGFYAARLRRL